MEAFRKVGLTTCTALVLANMVGTGVFTSLGFQVAALSSPFLILLLWTLGGVVALCGALSYAELAAALPRSGGEYHFLSKCYHPSVGFMGGFVSVSVGFAAPIALAAMAFGKYFTAAVPGTPPAAVSILVVLALAAVHALTVRASGHFQVAITSMKVTLISVFILIGFLKGFQTPAGFAPREGIFREAVSGPFAVSLMFVLYSYSGWNAATYILGEVRSPSRVIPLALAGGTVLVMLLYLALNHAFLHAAPAASMAGELNVAQVAAEAVFGDDGGRIVAGIIALGLVSAISAMVWAGPRVAMVLGEDYPRTFGWLRRRNLGGIPVAAVVAQSSLTILLLLSSTFEQVLVYTQFALLACSFLAVLGVLVLRSTRPGLARPFRVPLYPLTPLLFLAISAFAMVYTAAARPWEAVFGALTLLAGLGIYPLVAQGGKAAKP